MAVLASLCATVLGLGLMASAVAQTGPLVGTVKTTEAWFLYRPGDVEKSLRLSVLSPESGAVAATADAISSAHDDYVAKFHVTGLSPATGYTYQIEDISADPPVLLAGPGEGLQFRTRMAAGARGVVSVAFASCATNASEPVWERMGILKPDQVILAGDTPYVDVADLATSRLKHRFFLETPFMQSLIRGTSTVGTWDDHDMGLNNGNGVNAADRRHNTRRAFVEYRAHEQYGAGAEGLYHKIDLGSMDIFLLDMRWFAQTASSPVNPSSRTAFGAAQWQWLLDELRASRAPFKVLAIGGLWEDKKNAENDDMFTYWHERDALLDFIRDNAISGVLLLGGDIHISRHLIHPQRVGYDLHDFITSPAHTSVFPSLNLPHPSVEWTSAQPRQFMTLTADTRVHPPLLTARFYVADGRVQREVAIPYEQLIPKTGSGLGRGLRAWWAFDGNLANQSVLGRRVDATSANGATLLADGGLRGGAVYLSRTASQYLRVARSALDDNAQAWTASLWCQPASLPDPGAGDKLYLIESTLQGSTLSGNGHSVSLGFRAAPAMDQINLEVLTHTLAPAGSASTDAPTSIEQGPFSCLLSRSLFSNQWAHVALTFDGAHLRLYINGAQAAEHPLAVPGPAAETEGFVIGGHRGGIGQNFDGLLDEIALWTRALEPAEINALYHGGSPQALPVETLPLDFDGDTLADWWENLHGLDARDAADAVADTDGDGVPAWLENEAGTSPLFDDSGLYGYLRGLAQEDSPGFVAFRHPSRNTLTFRIKGASTTTLQDWSPLLPTEGRAIGTSADELLFDLPPPITDSWFFHFLIENISQP